MFAVTGAFAINNSVFDIGVLGIMGIVGYFMEANGYPVARSSWAWSWGRSWSRIS